MTVTVTSLPPDSTTTVTASPTTITETLILNTPTGQTSNSFAHAESVVTTGPAYPAALEPASVASDQGAFSYFVDPHGNTVWLGTRTPEATASIAETVIATYHIVPLATVPVSTIGLQPDTTITETQLSTQRVTSVETAFETVPTVSSVTLDPLTAAEAQTAASSFPSLSVIGSMGFSYSRYGPTGSSAAVLPVATDAAVGTITRTTGILPHPPGATIGMSPPYANRTSTSGSVLGAASASAAAITSGFASASDAALGTGVNLMRRSIQPNPRPFPYQSVTFHTLSAEASMPTTAPSVTTSTSDATTLTTKTPSYLPYITQWPAQVSEGIPFITTRLIPVLTDVSVFHQSVTLCAPHRCLLSSNRLSYPSGAH